MKKNLLRILMVLILTVIILSCGKKDDTIKIVFLPNESNESLKNSREEFAKVIGKATGKEVEIITTTDYNIAVETVISGKAQIAYIGAELLLSARERSKDVEAVLTNSGASGTLEDAFYYSFIAVREEDAPQYKSGDSYDLKKMKGKSIAFVTNSSTSGFKVPAKEIVKVFGLKDIDELQEGKIFSKIMFGGSHPGTQVNLFKKDADIATLPFLRHLLYMSLLQVKKIGQEQHIK